MAGPKNSNGLTPSNQIFKPTQIGFFDIAKHEITEPMIILLLVVGFFYSIWGKLEDAVTIFVVISLLVLAEVYNEFRAKNRFAISDEISGREISLSRAFFLCPYSRHRNFAGTRFQDNGLDRPFPFFCHHP